MLLNALILCRSRAASISTQDNMIRLFHRAAWPWRFSGIPVPDGNSIAALPLGKVESAVCRLNESVGGYPLRRETVRDPNADRDPNAVSLGCDLRVPDRRQT